MRKVGRILGLSGFGRGPPCSALAPMLLTWKPCLPTVSFCPQGCCRMASARKRTLPSVTTVSPVFNPSRTRNPPDASSPILMVRCKKRPDSPSAGIYTTVAGPMVWIDCENHVHVHAEP
jgi:hypothetical protein